MCKTSSQHANEFVSVGDVVNVGDASVIPSGYPDSEVKAGIVPTETRSGTVVAGYSVLTKSMVGSGLFVMAHACSKFGIIGALFMIFVAGFVTWISLRALSILAIEFKSEDPSFYSMSQRLVPKIKWIIDIAVIVCCFGAASGYVITAGDLLSTGMMKMIQWDEASLSVKHAKMVIQAVMIVGLASLCVMKEISGTKFANLVGLTSLLYIVIATFVYCDLSESSSNLLYMGNFLTAIGSFPTFIFAFACQMNVFQIANELKNPTVKRMNIISVSSTLTGLLVYIPIMILPFMTFGTKIQENYLFNLDATKVPVQVAYILAALSVSISYVLQVHPLRRSLLSMYYKDRLPCAKEERRNRFIVVAAIMLATLSVAFGVDSIDIVTNFTGLIGGNTMCFLMPSILYIRHFGYEKDLFGKLVLAVLVFSVILYPLCLTGIVYGMVNA